MIALKINTDHSRDSHYRIVNYIDYFKSEESASHKQAILTIKDDPKKMQTI